MTQTLTLGWSGDDDGFSLFIGVRFSARAKRTKWSLVMHFQLSEARFRETPDEHGYNVSRQANARRSPHGASVEKNRLVRATIPSFG